MDDYISHYGVKRRSGRYPWGSGKRPYQGLENLLDSAVKLKNLKSVNSDMNSWEYGILIDGKLAKSSEGIDWSKYRTIPIDDIKKYHAGVCWDFVNYQHDLFKRSGYDDESHMFVMQIGNDPNNIVTHTFSTVNIGDKKYWFESSWLKHQGIHEVNSYKDVIDVLRKDYGEDNPYDVYKYNPDGLDKGLTNGEFFNAATKNLVYTSTKKVMHSETSDGEEVGVKMENDFMAHDGVKRRSGRYPWGSGKRPFQREGGLFASREKQEKDPEKMRRKTLIKSRNLRNMTTQDLRDMIDRVKKEQELKKLVEEDIAPGKRAIKKVAAEIGKDTLKKVAQGSLDYGIYLAMTDGEFNAKDLAKAIYPSMGKKSQEDQRNRERSGGS